MCDSVIASVRNDCQKDNGLFDFMLLYQNEVETVFDDPFVCDKIIPLKPGSYMGVELLRGASRLRLFGENKEFVISWELYVKAKPYEIQLGIVAFRNDVSQSFGIALDPSQLERKLRS
jgi:hypothetical protein